MAFDIIVFSQEELDNAVENGFKEIGLCDNTFTLPLSGNITYTAIGSVTAKIALTEHEISLKNIRCEGFLPERIPEYAACEIPAADTEITSVSSYISSYMMSSYVTSYVYEYETSWSTSYLSSMSSFLSSFVTSFRTEYGSECIFVNGYGINLI